MFQHTLATLRDLFDTYRDQQGNYGVVLDITSTFMAIVERGTWGNTALGRRGHSTS